MAVKAEFHGQGLRFVRKRHIRHRPVAGCAADSLGDVNGMVEIHVIRQIINPAPDQRLVLSKTFAHRRQEPGIGPDLRMTGHAGPGGRHAGIGGDLDRGMAKAAIDPKPGDVMLMTEGYWLSNGEAHAACPIGPRREPPPADHRRAGRREPKQNDPADQRCLWRKNSRHEFLAPSRRGEWTSLPCNVEEPRRFHGPRTEFQPIGALRLRSP